MLVNVGVSVGQANIASNKTFNFGNMQCWAANSQMVQGSPNNHIHYGLVHDLYNLRRKISSNTAILIVVQSVSL